jgi:hypothetical protein
MKYNLHLTKNLFFFNFYMHGYTWFSAIWFLCSNGWNEENVTQKAELMLFFWYLSVSRHCLKFTNLRLRKLPHRQLQHFSQGLLKATEMYYTLKRRIGEWKYTSTHTHTHTHTPNFSTRYRWVVGYTHRSDYPRGKSPQYPLDKRMGGPQGRSGRGGEKGQNPIITPAGNWTPFVHPVV